MSIILASVYGQQEYDDLCPRLNIIPCVKDTLLEISIATKQIIDITKKIQEDVVNIFHSLFRLSALNFLLVST